MSFFGDIVGSIGSEQSPAPPPKPVQKQSVPAPSVLAHTKPVARLLPNGSNAAQPANTLKRKVDDRDARSLDKPTRPTISTNIANKAQSKPSTPTAASASIKPSTPRATTSNAAPSSTLPGKAPPKGSYADILARAKQAQQQRTTGSTSIIKHQATTKEKISKLAERKRQEEDKAKADKSKSNTQSAKGPALKPHDRTKARDHRKSASPTKAGDRARVVKAPRPPLHAPTSYKGTMGKPSERGKAGAKHPSKRSRQDEYLATDEEDEGDDDGYSYGASEEEDGYGYDSEGSSDMEAGLDDLDREEMMALRAAKQDDARELELESRLKREKEERRKKLAAMAATAKKR